MNPLARDVPAFLRRVFPHGLAHRAEARIAHGDTSAPPIAAQSCCCECSATDRVSFGGERGEGSGRSLTRLWTIVEALRSARRGLTASQLIERSGGSKASVYRDLGVLRDAGVPIDKRPVGGEMRYLLAGPTNGHAVTPMQLAALLTARRSMSMLEGTRVMRELDTLIRGSMGAPVPRPAIHVPRARTLAPELIATIDRALEQSQVLRIRYRGARDDALRWRNVEPVELRVSSEQPYVVAWDRTDARFKTYKLARMTQALMLTERACAAERYDPATVFEHSRGIWSGESFEVSVVIRKAVARFVREWPLHPRQVVQPQVNGDIVVCARVAGLEESLRWVLSWGKNATVQRPVELRDIAVAELEDALKAYGARTDELQRGVSDVETQLG